VLERLAHDVIRLAARLQRVQDLGFVDASWYSRLQAAAIAASVSMPIYVWHAASTYLKRLIKSNMSSCDTSGYFRCSLIACMFAVKGGDRDGGGREEVVR
jgi:hypothetical protein